MKFSHSRAPFRTLIKIFYKFIFFPPRRRFFFSAETQYNGCGTMCRALCDCCVFFFAVIANFSLFPSRAVVGRRVWKQISQHTTSQAEWNRIDRKLREWKSLSRKLKLNQKGKKNSNHRNKELESMISFQFSISNPMTEKKCEKSAAKKSKSANMKDFLLRLYCAKWRHMNSYPKYFLEQTMPRAASSSNSMRYYTSSKCCVQNINI